ncbi:DUF4388 domain-containing protein [Thermus sediminis]|uniref:DUF4388 domain-containing protein n=1 Tax=Thermus sediminis TaxID=1761908 RepID=UPI000E3C4F6C|nr:DUF4388 domain-containing protein [Thermus sediminis]
MAIFGNLRDMPFPDLVAMLGRRSGVLEVFGLPGKRQGYAVALDGGKVVWVREGNRLLEPLEARSALQELLRLQEGAFEFTPGIPPAGEAALGWPLERLLLTMTTVVDEIQSHQSFLPDPKTRFQAAALEVWLEEPLWSFWERAKPLLQGGASAEDLAARLRLPLDEVRYYLYKLRLAGKVVPVRAYEETRKNEEKRGLFRRLLAALRGRGGGGRGGGR